MIAVKKIVMNGIEGGNNKGGCDFAFVGNQAVIWFIYILFYFFKNLWALKMANYNTNTCNPNIFPTLSITWQRTMYSHMIHLIWCWYIWGAVTDVREDFKFLPPIMEVRRRGVSSVWFWLCCNMDCLMLYKK